MPATSRPNLAAVPGAFVCPHCGNTMHSKDRRNYPAAAVGCYAPVYRCRGCGRYCGEPVRGAIGE